MKVLVVGSGGREHAMVWKLQQSLPGTRIFCAPGNAGIAQDATCVPISVDDIDGLLDFARNEHVDLTIVGPEAPLVAGIADRFCAEGLRICGPSKAAAMQTEGSKVEFKRFLARHRLPTAHFRIFSNRRSLDRGLALDYIRSRGVGNIVIKADGLMGGKGVTLPDTLEEAKRDLEMLCAKGSAGRRVVIEDRLVGIERSVMAMTDGKTTHPLPFTQDYKREGDGDTGRNTGGMGAHTLDLSAEEAVVLYQLLQKVVESLRLEGCTYKGFIYLGVIMTTDGPMILECNCRLGDPETQPILSSINGDFAELCMAVAEGTLESQPVPVRSQHAVCVVLASQAYPDASDCDDPITGLGVADADDLFMLFHAGTKSENSRSVTTTGKAGRILNVVALGETVRQARERAYGVIPQVHFPDMQYRKDIGANT